MATNFLLQGIPMIMVTNNSIMKRMLPMPHLD